MQIKDINFSEYFLISTCSLRKVVFVLATLTLFSCFIFAQPVEEISSQKAFQMLKNPSTYLIDVRSIAEYVFVGHPEMAFNIPLMFWSEEEKEFISNENFLEDIESRFKKDVTLIFICRSGGRSFRAATLVKQSGFPDVFSIKKGFEGDDDEKGYRTINGWKNSGLPYTYRENRELIYQKKKDPLVDEKILSSLE